MVQFNNCTDRNHHLTLCALSALSGKSPYMWITKSRF